MLIAYICVYVHGERALCVLTESEILITALLTDAPCPPSCIGGLIVHNLYIAVYVVAVYVVAVYV